MRYTPPLAPSETAAMLPPPSSSSPLTHIQILCPSPPSLPPRIQLCHDSAELLVHVAEARLPLRQCPTRKNGLQVHLLALDLVQQSQQALLEEPELGVDHIPGCGGEGGHRLACKYRYKSSGMGVSNESKHRPTQRPDTVAQANSNPSCLREATML